MDTIFIVGLVLAVVAAVIIDSKMTSFQNRGIEKRGYSSEVKKFQLSS